MPGGVERFETTVPELLDAYQSGETTVREAVDRYLRRIEVYDRNGPEINSVVTTNPNAEQEAERLDRSLQETGRLSGPLHGVPVVIKDQAETKGIRTTFGSEAFADYVPDRDAEVVRRLKDAGALILAKTNMPDWATSWYGCSSAAGRTKNPYDLDRDPGGSSSGTGAAVAANFGLVGIGEDTGGSVRVPSAFNNLFGIRVTPGRISRTGLSPLVPLQDTAGPMCRTVGDLALVLDVLVGYDPEDPMTAINERNPAEDRFSTQIGMDGLRGKRIGVLRSCFGDDGDPEFAPVNRAVERSLKTLEARGADLVDPVSIPNLESHLEDSSLYLIQSRDVLNQFIAGRDVPVGSFDEIMETGQYWSGNELLEPIFDGPENPDEHPDYFRAIEARQRFRRDLMDVFARNNLDAIACPDVQIIPPTWKDVEAEKWGTFSFPTNTLIASQSGFCALSMPAGLGEGVPVGLELIGKPMHEASLIAMAHAYEQAAQPRRIPESTPRL